MTDTQKYISNLNMPEKILLFKELYNELAGHGIEGDTELAHVNTFEASLLKSLGGSGTINEITGLREYKGGGGSPPPPPANQTVTQTSEFPTELKPFISDILGEAKGEFGREKAEGYIPFQGPQLAAFTPEQQAAFATGRQQFGAQGLAGTPLGAAGTYYAPALAATALGTAEIGAGDIGRRMDPFLQNVVDIAKREARRDEDIAQQGRAAQAVGAGSFGGSRQAIVEAEANRNLQRQLSDIQAAGLSTAFQNAQRAAEAQRARELAGGRQFAGLGESAFQRARGDITGLAGVGEAQQARSQQALDIARREFEEEKAFPQTALQRYGSIIRGFPLTPSQQTVVSQREPIAPSLAQTLLGGVGTGVGLYGAFGGFKKAGGLVGLLGGGTPTNPLRPPYNLFSGPSSRVGVPQYQGGGPLGVNLGGGYASGAIGGANTPAPVTSPTAPTANDLNSILEELRRRKLIGRSAGGLAGLTVSSHEEGKQPSLGSRIMNYGPLGVPSLSDLIEFYQTPRGEGDITSLRDPRYPWNIEVNPEMKSVPIEDRTTWQEQGGWEGFFDTAKDIAKGAGIVVDVDQARLDAQEAAKRRRQEQLEREREEIITSDAFGPRDEEGLSTMATVSPPESDPRLEIKFSETVDTTGPELGTPTPDPDPYATLLAQLPDTSAGLDEARAAEEKYLAALQGIEHDPDLWAAFAKASAQFGTATPQEGESLGTLAMKQMPGFIEDVVEIKGSEKDIGIRLAEAEKDMAVRAAGLKSAAAQQSFTNQMTLIDTIAKSKKYKLDLLNQMNDISATDIKLAGSTIRRQMNSLLGNPKDAIAALRDAGVQGINTESDLKGFAKTFSEKVAPGESGTGKDIENDFVHTITLMAKELQGREAGDVSFEEAIKLSILKVLGETPVYKEGGNWFIGRDAYLTTSTSK